MLTAEENERFTRVGPGTPCGELMRRYWHPVAASAQIAERGTRNVRLLGEDLVLYRDRSGGLGLLGPSCPHRGGGLLLGTPEADGLRCAYHGWLFDASGRCLEQPYEQLVDPDSDFKDKVRIKAYPVQELGGLVFAYLGPEPAPLLPRWDVFVQEGVVREVGWGEVPFNWMQAVENSIDAPHIVELHGRFSRYVLERMGYEGLKRANNSSGGKPRKFSPSIRTSIGMTTPGKETEGSGVGPGRPLIFPCMQKLPDGQFQIRVPVDDTRTIWIYYLIFEQDALADELGLDAPTQHKSTDVPVFDIPVPSLGPAGPTDWGLLDNNNGQDYAMLQAMGAVVDRSAEHLGRGDLPVILYRQLLREQIAIVEDGGDPMNTFRDSGDNECIEVPCEPRGSIGLAFAYRNNEGRVDRTQSVRKYSPIFRGADVKERGEEALKGPVF